MDQKLTALTADTTPSDGDIIYGVKDPGGSPLSRKLTWTTIKSFLKTYFDTLYATISNLALKAPLAAPTFTGLVTIPTGILNFLFNAPEGTMFNGRILPTVDGSGNLTVALVTLAGTAPSASDPVYVMIGGVVRSITGALSVVTNAGASYFNLGSAELATKEADLFPYLCWNSGTSVVDMFISRYIGVASGDFVLSGNYWLNEKGFTGGTPAGSCVNIGRFAATLSAGAGYTWSVPTFTASNLIQAKEREARGNSWMPQLTGAGGSVGSLAYDFNNVTYQIVNNRCYLSGYLRINPVGSWTGAISITLPFAPKITNFPGGYVGIFNTATNLGLVGYLKVTAGSNTAHYEALFAAADLTWAALNQYTNIVFNGWYEI